MDLERFYLKDRPPAISLRPKAAAAALGISLSTLERFTKAGEIPRTKVGRSTLYSVEALHQWLRQKGGTNGAN